MEVYAEMSRKTLKLDVFPFRLPDGVELNRKHGSRACYFTCNNEKSFAELIDLLDLSGMNWQKN